MSTLQEIEAAVPKLNAIELAALEKFVQSQLQKKQKVAWPDFEARLRANLSPKS